MATVLGLAMKISADASGVQKALTPVQKAFQQLDAEAKKVTDVFKQFESASAGAGAAQQRFATDLAFLQSALRTGQIDANQFADEFAKLEASAKATADAFSEGARLTEANRTAEEKRADTLKRLSELLDLGAINQETFNRASAEASGANAAAAESAAAAASAQADAERDRAEAVAAAARIIKANSTPQERYDEQLIELSTHLNEGRLTQDQYNRAAARARSDLDKVSDAADGTDKSIKRLSDNVRLLTAIEVGRVLVDGFQLLSGVFTRVSGQVTTLVSNVNQSIDRLNDFSSRTGIGVESLQAYSLAAKLAGVDAEAFGAAVQKLSVNIGKANAGDSFDKALRGIGLTAAELKALAPERQFSAIGDAIGKLPTAADRAAAAVQLFGKQGAALAPLFREGAASLDELRARADKLGIIVSETQVSNVADMNDAFDLVRSTVEGIAGQVIGNLAPAVTSVTEQFLMFVEEWSGAQGTGGTGIANAITDVLLKGAEIFARVFDGFIERFGSLASALESAGAGFSIAANAFVFVTEGLRTITNLFELAGNALAAALGKVLEGLGSFISSDLEQYGKDLQAQAMAATEANSRQLEDAASNAANAFVGIFTADGGTAAQAGQGAASQYLDGLRGEIQNARLPEVKVQADLASATADLDQFLATAEGGTSAFLEQSQATLATFSKMAAEGQLTADQIKIMNGFMESLNAELVKEKQTRQEATDAAEAQADADKKRLDQLLGASTETQKLEQDLLAVQREQARASEELSAARAASDKQAADAAAARLAQLDGLRTKLESQSQAIDQGFADGFSSAFDKTAESISGLIDKAGEFGNAGAEAAMKLQDGIAAAQDQARAGIIPQEVYDREVSNQRKVFDERITQIEKLREFEKANREASFKAQVDANERVNQFINQSMTVQQQNEAAAADASAERRLQAFQNITAIQERIATEMAAIDAAREQGDLKAAMAGVERVKQLDDALKVEQKIADGRSQELQKQQDLIAAQQEYQQQQLKTADEYRQKQQQAQQAYAQEQQKIFEEQQKAAAAEAARQEDRLNKLNTLGATSIKSQDVRTAEGASLVLSLAANAQDPALIQQRLQTKLLEKIAGGIGQAASNYFNTPVAIVGYSSFGEQR